jgi:hypothetical protein
MALDQWCWYWIVLEVTFLGFVLAATFLITGRYFLAAIFFAGVLGTVGVLQFIRNLCSDYTLQEVEAILEKSNRKVQIAEVFRAL